MKKKLLKSASVIALSAVMTCGAAAALAGCGGGNANSAYTLSVSMFCDVVDKPMNEANCKQWAAEYSDYLFEQGIFSEENGDKPIDIKFSFQSVTGTYFKQLGNQIMSNSQPDVFYVSPKYVKAWSSANRILDLSEALAERGDELIGEDGIWDDALAFYGSSKDPNYVSGSRLKFQDGKFVTEDGDIPVGIYGLPKDYSNFGLGFNEVFFTPEIREMLTTKKTTDRTGVHGAQYESAAQTYGSERGVVTVDGKDAPLINIGVPTFYKPYNFYRFPDYQTAVDGGDPMANAVEKFTDGQGYCVTIPGWPGDTFEQAKDDTATKNNPWNSVTSTAIPDTMQDPNAAYDTSKGYITYTYAEYSALTWAVTYFLNTYDWQNTGHGGVELETGPQNVYGNDQYDGVLYLLPWLAGNDAQYLDELSQTAINPTYDGKAVESTEYGNATYTAQHRQLNGKYKDVEIQYGFNSEKFIDTIGAFHAYGSDWNGNSNNAGDTTTTKLSGWDLFCTGNVLFYGVGTWNAGALNATDRDYLKYRLMPEPVSEDFALASYIKDADYNMRSYLWDADEGIAEMTLFSRENGDYGDIDAPDSYTGEEIMANQLARQDQWGARMDSVGYGVSALVADQGWKKDAAISLVEYLTVEPETQISLTYSGAQLPNFKGQCKDYYNKEGDFAEMITPDPDTKAEFDARYEVAKRMYDASTNTATRGMSIEQWTQQNAPDYVSKLNPQYKNDALSTFSTLAHAMRALYLVAYLEADRDLSLRMQYGLNATRDSAMYTYNDLWLTNFDPRGSGQLMAYDQQTVRSNMSQTLDKTVYAKSAKTGDDSPIQGLSYGTPAWFCLVNGAFSQEKLLEAIREEQNLIK